MAVTRWNPWGELFNLQDHMDQLFTEAFGRTSMPQGGTSVLPLDIRQTDEAYLIEASVPGFKPDEVDVTLDENVLTIRGEHKEENDESRGGYVRRERRASSVFRQIGLPAEVKPEGITATFENGVLTIEVPRAQKAQPRRIAVTQATDAKLIEGTAKRKG